MKKVFLFAIIIAILGTACKQKPEQAIEKTPEGPQTEVVHPDWLKDASVYEVNLRQFSPEGTINAFATHLPRIKELGIDILWFMPVHPIGEKNRKGELGSYYSVKDYKDINPEFGTMDDFKRMVQQAHALGLKVIIDWVPNHSSWDNPLVTEHPEWYALDSLGNMFSPWDWTDVVQFDYDQPGLRAYMIETFKYWLEEVDIDGFRMDVAHQVPVDFWNTVREPLLEVEPELFLLAEAENRVLHEKAFDGTYAWEFHHIMNEVAQGKKNVTDMWKYFEKYDSTYHPNDIQMQFTSNHDENSWNGTVWERMGDAAEAMAVLSYTTPGMPLIYNGQEAGLAHRLEFFVKDEIPWVAHPFNELYTRLNQLKTDVPALWNPGFGGDMELITNSHPEQVLSFLRKKGDSEVLAIFNFSPEKLRVTLRSLNNPREFTDFVSGETSSFADPEEEMNPWSFKLYYR